MDITGKRLTKTGRRLPSDLWWCTWPRHQPAHAYCHSGSLFEDTFVLQKKSTQHSHWYTHNPCHCVLVVAPENGLHFLRVAFPRGSLRRDVPESSHTSQGNHTGRTCRQNLHSILEHKLHTKLIHTSLAHRWFSSMWAVHTSLDNHTRALPPLEEEQICFDQLSCLLSRWL